MKKATLAALAAVGLMSTTHSVLGLEQRESRPARARCGGS